CIWGGTRCVDLELWLGLNVAGALPVAKIPRRRTGQVPGPSTSSLSAWRFHQNCLSQRRPKHQWPETRLLAHFPSSIPYTTDSRRIYSVGMRNPLESSNGPPLAITERPPSPQERDSTTTSTPF